MSDNVVPFSGQTVGPIPVDQVCDAAKDQDMVLIVAVKDGLLSVRASAPWQPMEVIGLLEFAKDHMLTVAKNCGVR